VGHAEEWAAVRDRRQLGSFSVRYLDQKGELVAALLANRPREVGAVRRELAGVALEEAA
jgi:hypothetical protein